MQQSHYLGFQCRTSLIKDNIFGKYTVDKVLVQLNSYQPLITEVISRDFLLSYYLYKVLIPPMREVPSVQMAESLEHSKASIGPMVLMSGYMTKKTRSRNRWIRRWWQLLDDGMLLYFLSDKREKLLGQIDIGRTCYDVRHGAKSAGILFPRVAPKCCCFSFSVLKRTYYMYAPTAAEAKKWSDSIRSVSNVLNRRVVAGVARRKAPEPPGPPRPPSCPPNFRISMTPLDFSSHYNISLSNSLGNIQRIKIKDDSSDFLLPRRRSKKKKRMANSVPDYLDRVGLSPSPPQSPVESPSSRMWLDGSPPPEPTLFCSPTKKTPIVAVAGGHFGSISTYSRKSSVSSPYSPDAQLSHNISLLSQTNNTSPARSLNSVCPLWRSTRRRHSLPESFIKEFDRLEKREEVIKQRLESLGIPPRPASVATYPKSCYSYQPQPIPRHHHSIIGSVQVIPVELKSVLRHKTFSKSTDSLSNLSQQEKQARRASTGYEDSTSNRPVPKPRKLKGAMTTQDQAVKKRSSRVRFSDQTHILNAASPTGSDDSVSLSTGLVLSNPATGGVDIEDLPPPRPRKDSGPPTFVPPPPPVEEKRESIP